MIKAILEQHGAYTKDLELDLLREFETMRQEIFQAVTTRGGVSCERCKEDLYAVCVNLACPNCIVRAPMIKVSALSTLKSDEGN